MSWYREEYLKSEDWKNLRKAILIYQDYICECCGGEATDVHHLLYRKIWDVTPVDLMACCRHCHDAIHEFLKNSTLDWRPKRRRLGGKKAGIAIRAEIALFVSPRWYVEFKPYWTEPDPDRPRVRIPHYTKEDLLVENNVNKSLDITEK